MKKLLIISVISFMMLSSCEEEAVLPSDDQGLSISQTTQAVGNTDGAVPFKEVIIDEFEGYEVYNPCTDEIMTLSGRGRIQFHGVVNGNKSTLIGHGHSQDIKGVGESGRKYVVAGGTNSIESSFANGVYTIQYVYTDHFITPGSGNDFIISEIFHIIVDAEGEVTYLREPVAETYCR